MKVIKKSTANSKQDLLISGINLKTVNGQSLLGSGNIILSSGASNAVVTASFALSESTVVTGTNVTLFLSAASELVGGSIESFTVTIVTPSLTSTSTIAATNGAATKTFIATGNAGDVLSVSVVATDNLGNVSTPATRLVVITANQSPTVVAASFTLSANTVLTGTNVTLSLSGVSALVGGSIASFTVTPSWTSASTVTASNGTGTKTLTATGNGGDVLSVSVVAVDNFGNTSTPVIHTITITANQAPTGTITVTKPASVMQSSVGNQISFSGATDPEGQAITYTITATGSPQYSFSKTSGIVANEVVTFTAPSVASSTNITFSVKAVDSLGAAGTAQNVTLATNVNTNPVLLATYTSGSSFVASWDSYYYSSFQIELIGGKGAFYYESGASVDGGIGAKSTFVVPVSAMQFGSTQTYTIGVNAVGYDYDTRTGDYAGNGTASTFKGMSAGGGIGATFDDYLNNYGGSDGVASGITYTNTTPNQIGYPPSMKIYGIPATYPVISTVTKIDNFVFDVTSIPTGTQIDASGFFGRIEGDFGNSSNLIVTTGNFPTGYYFYFNNTGTVPLTLYGNGAFYENGTSKNYLTVFGGEKFKIVKRDTGWEIRNISKTYQNVQIITSSTTFTPPANTLLVNLIGSRYFNIYSNVAYHGGFASKVLTGVSSNQLVTLSVSDSGETSSFGSYLTATGGSNGALGHGFGGTTNVTDCILYIELNGTMYVTNTTGQARAIIQW